MLLEKGKIVVITKGSDAGKEAVVDRVEGSFVYVKVGDKERKVSIRHVEPTSKTL